LFQFLLCGPLRPLRLILGAAILLAAPDAVAQQRTPRIWDIPFGTHVRDLPTAEFVDPACGTNGGPPGLVLGSFEQFARCMAEPGGLREIWFIYDDTLEHVGLARREPALRPATVVLDQPVILSFLIDGDGLVQGLRIVTDPRADPVTRLAAHEVVLAFHARFGAGRGCADLPRADGEMPIDGLYVKQRCEQLVNGRRVVTEARHYYKPGQQVVDPLRIGQSINEFESSSRVDVLQAEPSRAPAIAASARMSGAPSDDPRAAFLAGRTKDCPGCDLGDADLRRRDLGDANLAGANLAGAVLHRANLRRVDLTGAVLTGANLNRANLAGAKLRGAKLGSAMLYRVDATRADFTGADFQDALMGKAIFAFTNLTQAKLDFTDLGEARLTDANLVGASLTSAYMPLAVMFRADLSGAVADNANLAEAGLRGARLAGTSLREADLFSADLTGADLSAANFTGAHLLSAHLGDTNQTGTVFTGARMPDNSVHP
jgi:uncharacterized protein YjbI with pentapeptide repeats